MINRDASWIGLLRENIREKSTFIIPFPEVVPFRVHRDYPYGDICKEVRRDLWCMKFDHIWEILRLITMMSIFTTQSTGVVNKASVWRYSCVIFIHSTGSDGRSQLALYTASASDAALSKARHAQCERSFQSRRIADLTMDQWWWVGAKPMLLNMAHLLLLNLLNSYLTLYLTSSY